MHWQLRRTLFVMHINSVNAAEVGVAFDPTEGPV